ncbi:MAG: Aldehyde oxidase and xanthine dehydrogenase [Prosthecobacter sp.]|nr:Aldehyde oxidase and xanthine dehydrogenase [Prosthecobacter sp.]
MNAPAPLAAREQGKPINRVDGRLKVTGAAKYPAEFSPPKTAHAWPVTSTISKGSIKAIDISAAEHAPGVLSVITHLNALKLAEPPNDKKSEGIRIEQRAPLKDATVHYGGQYVALVVAEKLEQARHAAGLIKITYAREKPAVIPEDAPSTVKKTKENMGEEMQVTKGDVEGALANAEFVRIEHTYSTPTETHNPMECSATIAVWDGPDKLTIYDSTQYVKGAQGIVAHAFGLKVENVHVVCPFVGGAFGCKGPVWPHTLLAIMAAKITGRPVKLELRRQDMFTTTGHRPTTVQKITLAASKDGKLQAVRHLTENPTSPVGEWMESAARAASSVLYDAPAIEFGHTVYTANLPQPSFMRAPGECPGVYALECAVDEMAYALNADPLEFRRRNASTKHPMKGVLFSTKHLDDCYKLGAEKFGWALRKPEPRSMRDEQGLLVGWGVATATYPANKWDAEVWLQLHADGSALVRCAAHDLGTGAYTVLTQISADALGLESDKVKLELGDSALPAGPVAGGSNSTATAGSAITVAARNLHAKLAAMAVADAQSPLFNLKAEELLMSAPGQLGTQDDAAKTDSFSDLLKRAKLDSVEATGEVKEEENEKLSFQSFGAHFCEVKIDPDLPLVRVTRFVSVMDCGRVINPKTGGSQIIGGVVMGIGMALHEETVHDPLTALPVARNLSEYLVPVNADIHAIEVYFAGEPDLAFNPMGARGMGEIGITGAAAAIANAVFHATGKRVRDLPITLDKLM